MASRTPNNQSNNNSSSKPALKKPVFIKVDNLKPVTQGHNLVVKVVSANVVPTKKPLPGQNNNNNNLSQRPGRGPIVECLVGDETGTVLFTARNEQVDLMKPGSTVILRNAKVDMFKGSMRLAVDRWGRIEVTMPAQFVVKEDNNLSLVEYELVNVVEE